MFLDGRGSRIGRARPAAVGGNLQSAQKGRLCQQPLAVKFCSPPGCLRQAWEVRLGPRDPEVLIWPWNHQPKIKDLVLLLTTSVLCNVNGVTSLTGTSWENEVVHSKNS